MIRSQAPRDFCLHIGENRLQLLAETLRESTHLLPQVSDQTAAPKVVARHTRRTWLHTEIWSWLQHHIG